MGRGMSGMQDHGWDQVSTTGLNPVLLHALFSGLAFWHWPLIESLLAFLPFTI